MKPVKILLPAVLGLTLLAGCGGQQPAQDTAQTQTQTQPETLLGKMVADKTAQMRQSLPNSSLMIGGGQGIRFNVKELDNVDVWAAENNISGLPLLEVTAQGEVLINQQRIALSPEQQALTARYHRHAQQIADAGLDIAIAGADLGGSALMQVASGFLNGKNEAQIEAELTAQAEKIKTRARGLCQQINGLMDIQNQIARTLPQFEPYALIEPGVIDKCLQDAEVGITDDGQAVAP
ncbi:hypothetical protein CO611_03950 [Lysobacteraceae bacterium NML03-0222]|nr:hypothetical protein CO611_03950 [Xanthomonadaceae bacterium NML03-0222]